MMTFGAAGREICVVRASRTKDQAQERRLRKLDCQPLPERLVKDGVAGGILPRRKPQAVVNRGARPPFPKPLREFQQKFATEESCQLYLAACL